MTVAEISAADCGAVHSGATTHVSSIFSVSYRRSASMIQPFDSRSAWIACTLAIVLLWAPLPFGSVTPTALAGLRLASFALLAVAWVLGTRGEPTDGFGVPAAALLGVAAIGLLQAVPLPGILVGWLAPVRVELAGQAGQPAAWVPLSLAPRQSVSTALTLAAVCAIFAVSWSAGRWRGTRRWVAGALVLSAVFQLLYGFRHLAAGSKAVWGLEVARDAERLRGTFVNPAHFALYLEIVLAVSFSLLWLLVLRARRVGWRTERLLLGLAGLGLLWLVLLTSLAFTRSRAGLVAALLATAVQGAIVAAYHRRWRLLPVGLLAGAAGIAAIAWVGLERGLGRILGTSVYSVTASARIEVWQRTLDLWRDSPLLGVGLGAFEVAFPMVETPELATVIWRHAHNDWVELLATGGILALLLALAGCLAVIRRLHANLFGGRDDERAAAALAGLGALSAVGLHELLDFGLTQPANAWALAILLGVACAAEEHRRPSAVDR